MVDECLWCGRWGCDDSWYGYDYCSMGCFEQYHDERNCAKALGKSDGGEHLREILGQIIEKAIEKAEEDCTVAAKVELEMIAERLKRFRAWMDGEA